MDSGRYYIYEILENGIIRKASHVDFETKEEAKSIIRSMHPMDRKKLFAVKLQG